MDGSVIDELLSYAANAASNSTASVETAISLTSHLYTARAKRRHRTTERNNGESRNAKQ